jgi:ribonuclease P/MRP protein subunit RPP1
MQRVDLNVPLGSRLASSQRELDALEAKVRVLFELGYDKLALAFTVRERSLSASDDVCPPAVRRLAASLAVHVPAASSVLRFGADAPSLAGGGSGGGSAVSASAAARKRKKKKKRKREDAAVAAAVAAPGDAAAAGVSGRDERSGSVLTRLTVETASSQLVRQVADGACGRGPFADVVASYDLLAVRPTSQAAFDAVCRRFAPPAVSSSRSGGGGGGSGGGGASRASATPAARCFDIVAIDATVPRPLFRLDRALIAAARKRGAIFELCYSPAVRDAGARAHFFANAGELLRALGGGGRAILMSSECADAMEARAPRDVVNLAVVAGFTPEHAAAAVSSRAVAVVEGAARRHALRGAGVLRRDDGAARAGRRVVPARVQLRPRGGEGGAGDDGWALLDFGAAHAASTAHAAEDEAGRAAVEEEEAVAAQHAAAQGAAELAETV